MRPEDFRALTAPLPEAYLLVSGGGHVLAANGAAAALFRLPLEGHHTVAGSGPALADLVRDPPERVRAYLRACSRSTSLLPGALSVGDGSEPPVRYRSDGALLRATSPDEPRQILLRIRRDGPAVDRFALLTRQVEELTREVRLRRQVEAERAALLEEATRARVTLEEQAAELEQQREEAQMLAEELEQANEELAMALTEAERARDSAESANQAKADFLATMSHELRTPLNAIGGYVELLTLGVRGAVTPAQQADLARIGRNQRTLLSLINDVLNFARLDAGRLTFTIEDVPVAQFIDGADAPFEPQLRAKQLRYSATTTDPSLVARADPERARQIVANLLSNAVKFTPAGGEIAVSCELAGNAGEWVAVRVRDTGIGIPPDKHEAVFEPFVQLGRGLTTGGEGTGLGLSISRDLARGMGGELLVESVVGQGSTFTLLMPRPVAVAGAG